MKHQVKIDAAYGPVGTKVLDGSGNPIADEIRLIEFRHEVGGMPTLRIECYAQETVIEGEIEVRRVVVCPCCKKELEQQLEAGASEVGLAEVTSIGDEYRRFLTSPWK